MMLRKKKQATGFLRICILLLILPIMYLMLWISISANDALIYAEKVLRMKSYLPDFAQNLRLNVFIFLGMCSASSLFGYLAWRKNESRKMQNFSLIFFVIAAILSIWFLMSLL